MNKAKKILALVMCAVLLVGASVMGTVAYLTSEESVKNVFTVGDVVIYLDEMDIDKSETKYEYDALLNAGRDLYNEYKGDNKLIPGRTVVKDPTIWVKEDSEKSYIRMIVTVENYSNMLKAFDYDDGYIVTEAPGMVVSGKMVVLDKLVDRDSANWQCVKFVEDDTADTGVYEFRYYPGVYEATDNNDGTVEYNKLPALFTKITVPAEIDNAHLAYLNNATITVEAHAIQAEGFTTADAAWDAFGA